MHINPLYFPTLALAFLLFFVGRRIGAWTSQRAFLWLWYVVALLFSFPAILFDLFYTHILDQSAWFYAFRSLPMTELTAAGIGLGFGLAITPRGRTPSGKSPVLLPVRTGFVLFVMALLLFAPYIKPVLAPLRVDLQNRWSDGVCLQSTSSTCGPASAATLLRQSGKDASERDLASECFSYGGGTENWYIARALRNRGLNARYRIVSTPIIDIPYPAIAGTRLGKDGPGHFIAILGRSGEKYVVGDPLSGKHFLTREQLQEDYYLTGFFLVVG